MTARVTSDPASLPIRSERRVATTFGERDCEIMIQKVKTRLLKNARPRPRMSKHGSKARRENTSDNLVTTGNANQKAINPFVRVQDVDSGFD